MRLIVGVVAMALVLLVLGCSKEPTQTDEPVVAGEAAQDEETIYEQDFETGTEAEEPAESAEEPAAVE